MKGKLFYLFFLFGALSSAQVDLQSKDGDTFKSVFSDIKSGSYTGLSSGLLIVERNANQILIDFQNTPLKFKIEEDEDDVYDVSYKAYNCKSTSGKTIVEFEWYAMSNAYTIYLNGIKYELNLIDGACDMVIDGLEYNFYQEQGVEYLTLLFTKPVRLYHLETEKYITVQPNSYLLFTIKHNLKP